MAVKGNLTEEHCELFRNSYMLRAFIYQSVQRYAPDSSYINLDSWDEVADWNYDKFRYAFNRFDDLWLWGFFGAGADGGYLSTLDVQESLNWVTEVSGKIAIGNSVDIYDGRFSESTLQSWAANGLIDDLSFLSNLTRCGGINFANLNTLYSLNGLESLTRVDGGFFLQGPSLSDISALRNLENVNSPTSRFFIFLIQDEDFSVFDGLNLSARTIEIGGCRMKSFPKINNTSPTALERFQISGYPSMDEGVRVVEDLSNLDLSFLDNDTTVTLRDDPLVEDFDVSKFGCLLEGAERSNVKQQIKDCYPDLVGEYDLRFPDGPYICGDGVYSLEKFNVGLFKFNSEIDAKVNDKIKFNFECSDSGQELIISLQGIQNSGRPLNMGGKLIYSSEESKKLDMKIYGLNNANERLNGIRIIYFDFNGDGPDVLGIKPTSIELVNWKGEFIKNIPFHFES